LLPSSTLNRKYAWTAALFVLFAIAVLLIHSIHTTPMIADEYLVYRFTRSSFAETIDYLANRDVHPPLWFSFFWVWQRLVGDSDFAGRMQAVLFSMMTLSIVYQLGRRWFGAARYGVVAMILLAVSALYFQYSLQIRPYALALFLASLSMFALQSWLTLKSPRSAAFYAATVASLLYVHYFLFVLILTQALYFVLQRPSRQLLRQAFAAAVLGFVFWLPWFPSFLVQFQHIRRVELASGDARGIAGSSVTTQPTSLESITQLIQLATNGQVLLYALALLIGLFYGWRKANYRLALAWAMGVPGVAFTGNLLAAIYTPRYIVNFVIGLALVLAAGLAALPVRLRWAAVIVFAGISLWAMPSQFPTDIAPFYLLFRDLKSALQPGDVIFLDKGYGDDVMKWNYNRILTQQNRNEATMQIDEALNARRIWHLTSEWLDPDVQANFRRIETTHPRQSGFGQCDAKWCYLMQLMEAPPWTEPQTFGADMAFWGADVDAVTTEAIQTRLWWKVEQSPTLDYSMSLRLLDANGKLVTQVDGPINHYGVAVVNTSQLEPGRIYIDFRTLNLPQSILPGNYVLELVVYDWQTNIRLLLADGSDHLTLNNVLIEAS
jgi:uncharacterized membrane protein